MSRTDSAVHWTPCRLREQFPILEREINGNPLCYLDNAATTFSPRCVLDAVAAYESHSRANVQRGMHQLGSEASAAYELARGHAARYLNAQSADQIVFTSGTTLSMNLLAHSLGESLGEGDEIVVSVAEHHSNFVPWQRLCQTRRLRLKVIPVLANGRLDLERLDQLISNRCRIVAIAHVSNVSGNINDVRTIARAAHRQGAKIVVDGAQAAPHGPVDVPALEADFYAFSGHKCYGPSGIGVLWGRDDIWNELPPFLTGGGMVERVTLESTRYLGGNHRFEAGTPPVAQAIGLGCALQWLSDLPWGEIRVHEQRLLQRILRGFEGIDGLRLVGAADSDRRTALVSFDIDGCHPHDICQVLDDFGVALRGGHHCAQPLMDALGLVATTRASLAVFNNERDIEMFLHGLHRAVEILR